MDAIFLRLAAKWERESTGDNGPIEDTTAAACRDAKDQGKREQKKECAKVLRDVVALLGES